MGGGGRVEQDLVEGRLGYCVEVVGHFARYLVCNRNVGGNSRLVRIGLGGQSSGKRPEELPFSNQPRVVIGCLHRHDHGAGFGSSPRLEDSQEIYRMPEDVTDPLQLPGEVQWKSEALRH